MKKKKKLIGRPKTRSKLLLPSGSKISVSVGESRGKLSEVTVERRREALESDPKVFVETLEDSQRQCALRAVTLIRLRAHVGLVPF